MSIRRRHFFPWLVCIIGATFYLYEYLLRVAPSVMEDALRGAYHLSASQYGNLTAYYYYAYTPVQLVVGVLMDRYGPRRLLALACASCAIGAFLFGYGSSVPLAAFSRFLIGFGSAFAFVGALKLAAIWLPKERFAFAAGTVNALGMFGAMAGDVLLAKIMDHCGWRSTVLLSAWMGVVLVVAILLLVFDHGSVSGDDSTYEPVGFGQVFSNMGLFLRNRDFWINGLIGGFLYLALSAFAELWGVPYLMQAQHLSRMQAAYGVSVVFFGWLIGGIGGGWLSDLLESRKFPLAVGSFIGAASIACILYIPHMSLFALYTWLLIFGLATSVEIVVFAVSREITSRHVVATSISLTNMMIMASGALFQPFIGVLLDWGWSGHVTHGLKAYSAHDYQFALTILPIILIVSGVMGLYLRESYGNSV